MRVAHPHTYLLCFCHHFGILVQDWLNVGGIGDLEHGDTVNDCLRCHLGFANLGRLVFGSISVTRYFSLEDGMSCNDSRWYFAQSTIQERGRGPRPFVLQSAVRTGNRDLIVHVMPICMPLCLSISPTLRGQGRIQADTRRSPKRRMLLPHLFGLSLSVGQVIVLCDG